MKKLMLLAAALALALCSGCACKKCFQTPDQQLRESLRGTGL